MHIELAPQQVELLGRRNNEVGIGQVLQVAVVRVVVDARVTCLAVDGVGLHDDTVEVVVALLHIAHDIQRLVEPVGEYAVLCGHLFVVFPQFFFAGRLEEVIEDKEYADAQQQACQQVFAYRPDASACRGIYAFV